MGKKTLFDGLSREAKVEISFHLHPTKKNLSAEVPKSCPKKPKPHCDYMYIHMCFVYTHVGLNGFKDKKGT